MINAQGSYLQAPLRVQTPCWARLQAQCTLESRTRCTFDASETADLIVGNLRPNRMQKIIFWKLILPSDSQIWVCRVTIIIHNRKIFMGKSSANVISSYSPHWNAIWKLAQETRSLWQNRNPWASHSLEAKEKSTPLVTGYFSEAIWSRKNTWVKLFIVYRMFFWIWSICTSTNVVQYLLEYHTALQG